MMKVTLISCTLDAEKVIEYAGRVCYNSLDSITGNSHGKFIKRLISNGHLSVLEHASATFDICHVSRALSHQLVRHRIASYSQQSQRYVSEEFFSNDNRYTRPKCDCEDDLHMVSVGGVGEDGKHDPPRCKIELLDYSQYMRTYQKAYRRAIDIGLKAEDARLLLPNAIHTRIVMTMNFREFRHFFDERGARAAQWEIRELAIAIFNILKDKAPNVFADYTHDKEQQTLMRPIYVKSNDVIQIKGTDTQLLVSDIVNDKNNKES